MNWMKSFRCKTEWMGKRFGAAENLCLAAGKLFAAAGSLFANVWAFLMLTVFPLYAPNQYFDLGEHKFNFFLESSVICLLPALVLLGSGRILELWNAHSMPEESDGGNGTVQDGMVEKGAAQGGLISSIKTECSVLDIAVLCYLAAAVISYVCSDYRQEAWTGADGWFMGLRTQLLLGTAYFCISRARLCKKILLAGHFFSSQAACLLGILHRFHIDPLGMYDGISEKYFLEFLSTLGQATWFSSYLCTVLVIGIAYFFLAQKTWIRILSGLYCMLGFAAVVTQNSDSAFLAMAALMVGLFCISCRHMDRMEGFLEILLLMLGSFKVVGLLQQIFAERALQLDELSVFLTQSSATWFILLAVSLVYLLFQIYRMKHEEKKEFRFGRRMAVAAAGFLAFAAGAYVLVVWANTTGRLQGKIHHPYLLFDSAWGNFRGLIWSVSAKMFGQMDGVQKLVGVGPDCYQMFCYADPVLGDQLSSWFGTNQIVTNAHNEFLNVLICLGILGLAAFLAIFGTAARRFLGGFGGVGGNHSDDSLEALVLAGGLAVLTYCAHNLFCYQQVCCTPFLFLILAAAENCMRQCRAGTASMTTDRDFQS